MEGKHKIVRLPLREDKEELKLELKRLLRDRFAKIAPFITGGVTAATMTITGIETLRFDSYIALAASAASLAVGAAGAALTGYKVFKSTQRDVSNLQLDDVKNGKLSINSQMKILKSDNFEFKTALLNNPNISEKAMCMLRKDQKFEDYLVQRLNKNSEKLYAYEKLRDKYPNSTTLKRAIEAKNIIVQETEHSLGILFANDACDNVVSINKARKPTTDLNIAA